MTKEITKAIILQELEDKFKLRDLEPERFTFSEQVVPTYDIDSHLSKWVTKHNTKSITSATSFLFFGVPYTERWLLRAYQIVYGMTGAHKGSGLYVDMRPVAFADYIYLDLKKGQEVSYLVNLPVPVVLEPGNRLSYLIDDYTSDQDLSIDIDVRVEEIR